MSKTQFTFAFRFRSVNCGVPGSRHDAYVLKQSDLFINADKLPSVSVGDASFRNS